MKKAISVLLVLFSLMSILSPSVYATNEVDAVETLWLEDGSYVIVSIEKSPARVANTVSGFKTCTGYGGSGQLLWEAKLEATFAYSGGWYTCTTARCDVTIYAGNWYVVSNNTLRSSNNAYTYLTMGSKLLGITVSEESYTIKLTCDSNGNLS